MGVSSVPPYQAGQPSEHKPPVPTHIWPVVDAHGRVVAWCESHRHASETAARLTAAGVVTELEATGYQDQAV